MSSGTQNVLRKLLRCSGTFQEIRNLFTCNLLNNSRAFKGRQESTWIQDLRNFFRNSKHSQPICFSETKDPFRNGQQEENRDFFQKSGQFFFFFFQESKNETGLSLFMGHPLGSFLVHVPELVPFCSTGSNGNFKYCYLVIAKFLM